MDNVIPLKPNLRSIKRLAKLETARLYELYHLSAGFQDPLPEIDPEVLKMVEAGMIEYPWREF